MVRTLGVTVAIIGWLYIAGGRTGSTSFGLATVIDRLLLPFLLVPLALLGMAPLGLIQPLSVLDPVLGVAACLIWRSERVAALK